MASKPNQIHYISSHPTDLGMFHGLRQYFRTLYPDVRQVLTMVGDPNLALVDHHELDQGYDSVQRVSFHETASTNQWRSEYRIGSVRKRFALLKRSLEESREFSFAEDSLCFISEMSETTPVVRLLIAKLRRESKRSVLCRVGTCFHKTYECKTNNRLSWIENNLYSLFSGAAPVSVKFYDWMIAERRFHSKCKTVDHLLVFSNRWAETAEYHEIKYPLLDARVDTPRRKPYVLYLDHGTGWLSLFPGMSVERYLEATNRVLAALTELYKGEDVDLLFKPHPRGHVELYEFAGFNRYEGNEPAELIFTRDAQVIRAVYSPVSTGVRTASMYGIPAYIFDEVFDLPEEQRVKNKSSILDFSDVIDVRSLDELDLPPVRAAEEYHSTPEDLEKLGDLFQNIVKTSGIRSQ